jgi:hypothetical protein
MSKSGANSGHGSELGVCSVVCRRGYMCYLMSKLTLVTHKHSQTYTYTHTHSTHPVHVVLSQCTLPRIVTLGQRGSLPDITGMGSVALYFT